MSLIKCPECGKEISDMAISCPNCGMPIKSKQKISEMDNISQVYIAPQVKKKRTSGCLVFFLTLFLGLFFFGIAIYIAVQSQENRTENVSTYNEKVIDNVEKYSNISQEQLVEKFGNPLSKEEWKNTTANGDFQVTTYIYDREGLTYEFIVAEEKVVRLTAYSDEYYKGEGENFKYNQKNMLDIPKNWGIELSNNARVEKNTGYALRIHDVSKDIEELYIQDIEKENKTYGIIKFTYNSQYFD